MGDVSDELTATLAHHAEQLAREGYTIVRDAFDADLAHALHADIDRLENLPITYTDAVPRRDLAPWCLGLALAAVGGLLWASLKEVRAWA